MRESARLRFGRRKTAMAMVGDTRPVVAIFLKSDERTSAGAPIERCWRLLNHAQIIAGQGVLWGASRVDAAPRPSADLSALPGRESILQAATAA
jgi:hypothetical protein